MSLFDQLNNMHADNEDVRDRNVIRSAFGYPGGKDKLVTKLLPLLPVRDVFVDVCGGSGIVTLNRPPSRVLDVYNDRWSGVTSFFQCVRDKQKYLELLDAINMTMHSREDFLYCRDNYANMDIDIVLRAAMFYGMMSKSFASMGRNWARACNSKVNFTRNIKLEHWKMLHYTFSRVQIENLDWKQCLKDFDSESTVFYIDPPYLGTFQAIYKNKFTEDTHREMLDYIFKNVKGFVAVSSYWNELYNSYPWDEVHKWEVHVTCDSRSSTEEGHRTYDGGSKKALEVLYVKESK